MATKRSPRYAPSARSLETNLAVWAAQVTMSIDPDGPDARAAMQTVWESVWPATLKYAGAATVFDPPELRDDIFQECYLILAKCVAGFDWSKNLAFTTYWVWAVKRTVGLVRREIVNRIHVPRTLGWSIEHEDSKSAKAYRAKDETRAKGEAALRFWIVDPSDIMVAIPDRDHVEPEDDPEQSRALADAIGRLPEKWQTVLAHRFGLDDKQPLKLHEIGKLIGLSKERVRQIEERAIKTLTKALATP